MSTPHSGDPGSPPEGTQPVQPPDPDITQQVPQHELGPGAIPYRQPDMTQPVPGAQQLAPPPQPQPWQAPQPSAAGWDEPPLQENGTSIAPVLLALGIGSLVAVGLGVYGGLHTPTGQGYMLAGFSSAFYAKAWLTSLVLLLVIVQLVSSLMIYGKLPGGGKVVGAVHRWSGRTAVVVSVPVAAHCLYAAGFQAGDTRVLLHSLLGTFVYGAFVFKMLVLTRQDSPGWVLPVAGGAVLTGFTGLWLTSALYLFTTSGLSF